MRSKFKIAFLSLFLGLTGGVFQVHAAAPVNNALYVSQSVPATVTAGQTFQATVTFKNSGTTSWTAATNYKLGSQSPQDNTRWGKHRVLLNAGETIAPGKSKSFTYTFTAPATAGTYAFQWRMVRETVAWFGAYSPVKNIVVKSPITLVDNATFVSQTGVPASITAGQTFTASITMKNSGTTSWTAVNNYKLGSQSPQDNYNWSVQRLFLDAGETVVPGQSKTFTYGFTAPATAGTYSFQWKMLQEQVKWFGALSTLQNITVNPKPIVPPVGVTPKTVRFVYLVSSDRTMRSDYRDAIDMASKNIQAWYQDKLDGYTFTLNNPAVEVAYSDKSAAWFTTNPNGTDQNSWGFYNTLAEASRLLGAKQFDPDYIWVLYSDGPGNSGRGGAGVAYLPEDDLLGLIGQHPTQPSINRWIGGMGHELGHALGLPHPTDTLADYQALMYAGFYNYPDAYLTISDKTTLLGSSFITYKGPVVPPVPVPERFTHSTGDFTHSQIDPGGTWLETSTLSTNTYTFNETSRDATYIYTIDLNRNMQLKLPIAGGMCYWSVDNGVTWNGLYTLTKV